MENKTKKIKEVPAIEESHSPVHLRENEVRKDRPGWRKGLKHQRRQEQNQRCVWCGDELDAAKGEAHHDYGGKGWSGVRHMYNETVTAMTAEPAVQRAIYEDLYNGSPDHKSSTDPDFRVMHVLHKGCHKQADHHLKQIAQIDEAILSLRKEFNDARMSTAERMSREQYDEAMSALHKERSRYRSLSEEQFR